MDPYLDAPESHTIPDEELDDDTLLQLEQDLAPKASDYYGVLNVSRTVRSCFLWRTIAAIHTTQCSRVMSGNRRRNQGCIQEALSILPSWQGKSECHPNKNKLTLFYLQHNDPNNKKVAEARFQVIQTAYEGIANDATWFIGYGWLKEYGIVLSDPIKRAIYDTYGEEGLNAKWEVGPKYKTSEEVYICRGWVWVGFGWLTYWICRSEPNMKRRNACNENKNWRIWYDLVANSSLISMRLVYSIPMSHLYLLGLVNHLSPPKGEVPCMHWPKHRSSNCLCDIHSRYIYKSELDERSNVY